MNTWKPRINNQLDYSNLRLSSDEAYVLSRIDGVTSLDDLASLTGQSLDWIKEIVAQLIDQGAIDLDSLPNKSRPARRKAKKDERIEHHFSEEEIAFRVETSDGLEGVVDLAKLREDIRNQNETTAEEVQLEFHDDSDIARFRQVFDAELAKMTREVRIDKAENASGDELCALCFDPSPKVIEAILDNPRTGPTHVALIVSHHQSAEGLNQLAKRPELCHHQQVWGKILGNKRCSDKLYLAILEVLSIVEVYDCCLDNELSTRARRNALQMLRKKFRHASPDECEEFIIATNGGCLSVLTGAHLSTKTIERLCRRTFDSSGLVHSLASFLTTPPKLIAHLFRQPVVQRSMTLKQLLKRHPQCPPQLKR
jgi:hypothetical protein